MGARRHGSSGIRSDRGRYLTIVILSVAASCAGPTDPDPGESPTITTETLTDGAVRVGYHEDLTAVGGSAPYRWDVVVGSLPAGLGLSPTAGEITGMPNVAGTSVFTVRVTGADGLASTKQMSLTIGPEPLRILFPEPHDAVLGVDYDIEVEASGGDGAYGWSIVSGSLPDGLAMSGAVISGRPTESGYFPIALRVESGGRATESDDRIRVFPTIELRIFLEGLSDWIASSIDYNRDQLPRNPHLASEIQAKVDLLSNPDLEATILDEALFEQAAIVTRDGRDIPIAIVFPADTMRSGARADFDRLGPIIGVLEDFITVPWPRSRVYEWYGFRLGHSGGGGNLYMEDRGTYADRGAPHDVIVAHELGHTYIGHEGLTQFLEVYGYNVVETGSVDLSEWSWMRSIGGTTYVPFAPQNQGVWALMDIYQLVGPAAMGRAYAQIHAIGAPYGVPLAESSRQAFVDESPAEHRSQVADLVLRI